MATRFWSLLLLQLPLSLRLVAATCFFPNGDTASDHVACSPSSGTSICCSEGFQCLSNGLCGDSRYENFDRVLRGGCTDKSWGSGCTSFCKTDWADRDESVYYCGSGKWCCASRDCCSEGNGIMDLGDPTVLVIAGEGDSGVGASKEQEPAQTTQAPAPTSQKQEEDKPTSTTQEQPVSSGAVGELHLPVSTGSEQNTQTSSSKVDNDSKEKKTSSTATATSTRSNPSSSPVNPGTVTVVNSEVIVVPTTSVLQSPTPTFSGNAIYKGSKNTIAMGIGIGIGFAALLFLAIFGGWFWLRRQKRKRNDEQGVMHRSVDSSNPFERREYTIELEGDSVPELAGAGLDPKEMGGDGKRVSRIELEAIEMRRDGKEKELKTWPL